MSRDNEYPATPDTEAPTLSTPDGDHRAPDEHSVNGSTAVGDIAPGELIADRFRIVGRLGSGGMGVVYRADDLVLGTSVALKFLPAALATDPVRLERLRAEVRLARRVAHPNVCRVYDIGDADGRPFLSMEYIDGEDLASLLRRIGRLPKDKAVELTREICAGVAAAHELGVIHRDLKPANVMIDGRGQARVADFGLAGAKDERGFDDPSAGTPAYMAPEQLRGAEATRRTDIYALGLLLYELFTGKRANDAAAVEAARRGDSSSHTPTNPSELVEGLDPRVERVIMSCLAEDPEDRPASALAVVAALPGGDPLAAMLKAGEMPSPELVAASGRRGSLPLKRATQLAALTLIGLATTLWNFGQHSLGDAIGGILPPEVLAHRAESLLADLGHQLRVEDSAWGHDLDWQLSSRLNSVTPAERRELFRSDSEPPLRFWYRSSPQPMVPWNASLPGNYVGNIVTPVDPPLTVPGMAFVRLGPRGNLMEVRVAPDSSGASDSPPALDDLLTTITQAAGLEPQVIEELSWTETPIMPGSSTLAWRVTDPRKEESQRVIVATLAAGRPSWVKVMSAPTQTTGEELTRAQDRMGAFFFAFFIGGALLAIRNLRQGQWDRPGSARLAAAAFSLCFAGDFIGSHHSLDPGGEVRGFFMSTAYGAIRGLMTWVLYVAIEPFIRKLRPKSMVSWSRLLSGRIADPAVGRDVLVGLTLWAVLTILTSVWFAARGLLGLVLPYWAFIGDQNPLDTAELLATTLRLSVVSVGSALGLLVVYVVLRRLCGRLTELAPALLWVGSFFFSFSAYHTALETIDLVVYGVISATGITYLAVRHGLLALVTASFVTNALMFVILTLDPTDWYFAPTAIFVALVVGLTVFGVRVAAERVGPATG